MVIMYISGYYPSEIKKFFRKDGTICGLMFFFVVSISIKDLIKLNSVCYLHDKDILDECQYLRCELCDRLSITSILENKIK